MADLATPASEIGVLAREMARAYKGMAEFYRDQMELSGTEADTKARTPLDTYQELTQGPPNQISWGKLSKLAEHDPDAALTLWEHIKAEARDELESGHRAVSALDWESRPWERAQFLAIRAAFREEWQPQGGIEGTLIDMMAQTYTTYLTWMGRLVVDESIAAPKQDGYWQPPRLTAVQAMDQSAVMADRFHRIFLRTLRALRDLRRYIPAAVVVQNAGQVNVGSQQVNITHGMEGE